MTSVRDFTMVIGCTLPPQVLACCADRSLLNLAHYKDDVKQRAREYLGSFEGGSLGESWGWLNRPKPWSVPPLSSPSPPLYSPLPLPSPPLFPILPPLPSEGAYSDSRGVRKIREQVAEFIEARDGYPCSIDNIFLLNGASDGIRVRQHSTGTVWVTGLQCLHTVLVGD